MSIREQEKENQWLIFRNRTVGRFSDSIKNWPEGEIKSASKLVKKSFNKRLKRLNKLGISIIVNNTTRPDHTKESEKNIIGFVDRINNDSYNKFENQLYCRSYNKNVKYIKNGLLIKEINEPYMMYCVVTNTVNTESTGNIIKNCPNCGSLLTIKELEDGCKFCRTKFMLSDFYPIVTNYYDIVGGYIGQNAEEKYKSSIDIDNKAKKIVLIIYSFLIIYAFIYFYKQCPLKETLIFLGFIILFLAVVFSKVSDILGGLIMVKRGLGETKKAVSGQIKNIKASAPLSTMNSKRQITNFMLYYDKNFTYSFFEGKIISMLKEIIFTDNLSRLSIFQSKNMVDLSNVVDSDYCGGMDVTSMHCDNNLIHIDLKIYMNDYIYENDTINLKKRVYKCTVVRNVVAKDPIEYRADIIKCKTCGASIDIDEDSNCKFCGNLYDLKDYDFVFENVQVSNY